MSNTPRSDGETVSLDTMPEGVLPETATLPIVGIGASAGGLEAFSQLLSNLPESTGMGFVLVQHLDPVHESHLRDLLSRMTKMPVSEAREGEQVLADRVYVIPPGVSLSLSNGALRLTPRSDKRGLHHPIDIFFRSLAEHNPGRAIGVILSGTGSDGAQGLEEIKASGGITFAQDPRSAGFEGMPQSAINEGFADFILSPADIAKELARLAEQGFLTFRKSGGDSLSVETADFGRILDLLQSTMKVDFTQYRDSTLKRRILRRMTLHHVETVSEYAKMLEENQVEVQALYQDFLINVTRFFRDPEVFEAIKAVVLPEIVKGKSPGVPIRIWVTGCSSGQEAYSLAILLLEFLSDWPRPPPFQIFASDLSEAGALEKARLGLYSERIESDVSPERLKRFFTKEGRGYRIRKDIRNHCIFARHDLIADPPFSRVDLVTCRNVLIYMSSALQRKVIPIFHYALNPGGYLLLGSSETVGKDSDQFEIIDREHKIYRRESKTTRSPHFLARHPSSGGIRGSFPPSVNPATHADFRREADRILLTRFPPACVLVNADLEILQFRGRTRPYLEPAQGEASFNLMKMANEGLFLDLRSAIQEAQDRNTVVVKTEVMVRDEGRAKPIRLEVIPVAIPISKETCFLILFEEDAAAIPAEWPVDAEPATEELILLRKETGSLRNYLQSVREQHDIAMEELKSSNEEHLSSNEELQSTNEELETAKEEFQSANEELMTVNEEMGLRNMEMGRLNNDLNNLQNSLNVPIVIVGGDMGIRRFNAAAGKSLRLIPSDLGRPLGDHQWDFSSPDLGQAVSEVVANGIPQDHEIRNREGRWQSLRIHPYHTPDNRIDGAVIILMDIDAIRTIQDRLRDAEEYASSIVGTVREPLLILREDLRVNTANASFYRMFRTTAEESEGRMLAELGNGKWNVPGLRELVDGCQLRDQPFQDFEMKVEDPINGSRTLLLNGRALLREKGMARLVLLSMEDITERKRAQEILSNQSILLEQAVKERTAELQASNEELEVFSYSVSHDLRAPLRAIRGYADALLEDFGSQADEGAKEYIRKIIQSGSRMDRLILDVLTYSRTALSEVHIKTVNLDMLVQDIIQLHPDLKGPGITLAVESPLLSVLGHESALAQCLSNLILNAVKFVPKGRAPSVRVRTEESGSAVRLWVEDNGIGIQPEHFGRIFGMFEKLDAGDTYAGTGIGLAIVKKSMERMGGSVGIESEPGQGSRFWLQLPKGKVE